MRQDEAVVFGVHMIKQVAFAFDRLDEISDHAEPGSPSIAFYMNGLYHLLTAMFLLDKDGAPTGGMFSRVYRPLGMGECLDEVYGIFDRDIGGLGFGEAIRRFRNKLLVHGTLANADLDGIYCDVDMLDAGNAASFHDGLHELRDALPRLAICLCLKAGIDPNDVGIHGRD